MYEIYQKLLDEKGIKTAQVCKATSIPQSTFSDWKKGKSKPKSEKLQKIADYFGVSIDYLTGKSEFRNSYEEFQAKNQSKKYFIEQYLLTLGYGIIYDSDGNVILDTTDAQYEISELDIKDLQKSVDSFTKFKLSELMSKSRKIPKSNTNIPIAAHNDFAADDEQQKLMKQDLDEL